MSIGLTRPAAYTIRVEGRIDEQWEDWLGGMVFDAAEDRSTSETTTLVGVVADQAALLGLLCTLYALGFPLLEVRLDVEIAQGGES